MTYNPSAVIKYVLYCVYVDRFPGRNVSCSLIMELSKIVGESVPAQQQHTRFSMDESVAYSVDLNQFITNLSIG